jgi:hypothetical protein
VEDPEFLIQRLDQMSKDTIAIKETDTGIGDKRESDNPMLKAREVKESLPVNLDTG